MVRQTSCVDCVCRARIFNYLSEEELALTDRHKTVVSYNRGETIFKQGAPGNHVVSFVTGQAMVYIENPDDEIIILNLVKPTEFLSGSGIYSDEQHHFSVKAITDSTVCFIRVEAIKEIMRTNHSFAEAFFDQNHRMILSLYNKLISLTTRQQLGRVAEALLYLHEFYGQNPFTLTITRRELAQMTNVSKEGIYRLLNTLVSDNIISYENGSVHILNMSTLEEICKRG